MSDNIENPERHPSSEQAVTTPKSISDTKSSRVDSACSTPNPDSGKSSLLASRRKRSPFNKKQREKRKRNKAAKAADAISGTSSSGNTEGPFTLTSDEPVVDPTETQSETVAPTAVDGATAVKAATQEYTGPCIVDTEKWRKRRLEALAAEKKAKRKSRRKDVDHVTWQPGDDMPISQDIWQSEFEATGLMYPGYGQPSYQIAVPFWHYPSLCGFYPGCIIHSEWNVNRMASGYSCCCAHGSYDCQYPVPPPMYFGNIHHPALYQSPPPYQVYPPSFGPGQPVQLHQNHHHMSASVGSSSTLSQTIPPSASTSENESLRALLHKWEDAKMPAEVTPVASSVEDTRSSLLPEKSSSEKSVYDVSHSPTGKEILRPVRFVEELERELRQVSGVKSPEKCDGDKITPSMASLFELSRMAQRTIASSPKAAASGKIDAPTALTPESNHPSAPSNSSQDSFQVDDLTTQSAPLPYRLLNTTVPVRSQSVGALEQEVPTGTVLVRIGISSDDLQSPSMYWDAKQTMSSSPPESKQSIGASHGNYRSASSGNSPISKRTEAATTEYSSHGSISTNESQRNQQLMSNHVRNLFGNPEFSDMQILLGPSVQSGHTSAPVVFYVHKNIIAASPYLYDIIQTQLCHTGISDRIHIFSGSGFTSAHAFGTALRLFYGEPLVSMETIRKLTLQGLGYPSDNGTASYPFNLERAQTDFALSYAASGAFLGCRNITERGIQLAVELLSWETVETVLNFSMTVSSFMIRSPDIAMSWDRVKNSPPPSPNSHQLEQIHELKYVWADVAFHAATHFIADHMSPDFKLYRRAQARFTPTRIPLALHTLPGSCCANPDLEKIQFGTMPSFASLRPTQPNILIPSSLLVTLPFPALLAALEAMKPRFALTIEVMKEVLEEREARRRTALRVFLRHRHWLREEIPPEVAAELGYREVLGVERTRPGDAEHAVAMCATIQRQWVGLKMPNEELLVPTSRVGRRGAQSS